jgi:hypothetical protein
MAGKRRASNAGTSKVRLGPFDGGLNNIGEAETLDDNELAELVNFEVAQDGSLTSRPPIFPDDPGANTLPSDTVALGYYTTGGGVTSLVVTHSGKTWLYSIDTRVFAEIWDKAASGFTQYDDKAVLCSRDQAGGYWTNGIFTSTRQMPRGEDIVFYQERFWIYGVAGTGDENRVSFSKLNVISPASSIFDWGSLDYFTVNQGDGQWITGIMPTAQRIYIFRTSSTYYFDYASSPLNGSLQQVSATVGADSRWCYVPYQNYYLVLSNGVLYLFQNSQYYPQSIAKVRFEPRGVRGGPSVDRAVSVFGDRAIVWWKGATYVFNITRRTWSRWVSPTSEAARFLQIPWTATTANRPSALAVTGARHETLRRIYRIQEELLSLGIGEQMACTLTTKTYTMDDQLSFKKLLWWGVEARTATGVRGTAVVGRLVASTVTWDEMESRTWDELELGTWDNPFIAPAEYVDDVKFPSAGPIVTVFRLRQALRFLRIQFQLSIEIDGLTGTSPAKINAIIPVVRSGAGAPGEAN